MRLSSPAAHSERKSQPMKHNASTLGRRVAAVAGVLTLAVLGLAPMAQAEDPNYGDIKTDASGSLIIHKHLTGDGNPIGAPDGTALNNMNKGEPVPGVVFTAYPITDVDLKDPRAGRRSVLCPRAVCRTVPAQPLPLPCWQGTRWAVVCPPLRPVTRVSPRSPACRSRHISCVRPRRPVTSFRRPSPSW